MRSAIAILLACGCATAPVADAPFRPGVINAGKDEHGHAVDWHVTALVPDAPEESFIRTLPPGVCYSDEELDELKRRHAEALQRQQTARLKTYAAILFGGILGGVAATVVTLKPWEAK